MDLKIKNEILLIKSWSRFIFWGSLLWSIPALTTPASLSYQGRIVGTNGKPLEYANVAFEFSITSADGSCVLYREQKSGVDMRNSGGVFDSPIGLGTKIFPTSPSPGLLDIFSNKDILHCQGGATYQPGSQDGRRLRVQFYDGVGWKLITPDNIIRTVPYAGLALAAESAQRLGTHGPEDFVFKNILPTLPCANSEVLSFDGTNFTCVTDQGGSGVISGIAGSGAITVTGAGNVTIGANIGTTAGTLAAGNDSRFTDARSPTGSAGGDLGSTYPNPKVIKIQGVDINTTAPNANEFLKFVGSAWTPSALAISDVTGLSTYLNGTLLQSQFPASCTSAQTLTWISPSGAFSCTPISLTGSAFGTQSAGLVFAGPTTGSANPTFRALVASDLPSAITEGLWTSSGSDIYRSSGNVGVGTTNPDNLLTLVTPENASGIKLESVENSVYGPNLYLVHHPNNGPASAGHSAGYLRFDFYDSSNAQEYGGRISSHIENATDGGETAGLTLLTRTNGVSREAVRIIGNGNVGIGVVAPLEKLHIQSGEILVKSTSAVNDSVHKGIKFSTDNDPYYSAIRANRGANSVRTGLSFFTADNASPVENLRITAAGSVGIGTISPTTKLEVVGTIKATSFEGPLIATTNSTGAGSAGSPSMTFSGDNDTGFFNASSDNKISVTAGGNKIFDFSSLGLVSATTGGAAVSTAAGSANAPTFSFAGDSDTGWFSPAADTLAAATAGSERARITPTGDIGIGTLSPLRSLHVESASGRIGAFKDDSAGTQVIGDILGRLDLGLEAGGNRQNVASIAAINETNITTGGGVNNQVSGALGFYTFPNTNGLANDAALPLERMRIDRNGNVGVGTSSPTEKFYVQSEDTTVYTPTSALVAGPWNAITGAVTTIRNSTSTTGSGAYIKLLSHNTSGTYQNTYLGSISTSAGSTPEFVIGARTASTAYAERFRIDKSGHVGIGTTSPGRLLQVSGTSASQNLGLEVTDTNTGGAGATFTPNYGGTGIPGLGSKPGFPLRIGANGATNHLTISTSGNIGLGTTAPLAQLHVSKTVTTGTITSSGTAVTGSGTNFISSLNVGDSFTASGQTRKILSIIDDTNMTVDSAFSPDVSSALYVRMGTVLDSGAVTIGSPFPTSAQFIVNAGAVNQLASTVRGYSVWGDTATNNRGHAVISASNTTSGVASRRVLFGNNLRYDTSIVGGTHEAYAKGAPSIAGAGIAMGGPNSSDGTIEFLRTDDTDDDNWVVKTSMAISSNGNVGIGTTNPGRTLDVAGWGKFSHATGDARLDVNSPAGFQSVLTFGSGTSQRWFIGKTSTAESGSDAGSDFKISNFDDSGSAISTPFTIRRSDGNIGIGTTTPDNLLDIVSTASNVTPLEVSCASGYCQQAINASSIRTVLGVRTSTSDGFIGTNSNHKFALRTNALDRAVIDSSGNFGIGTTSPSYTLHVVGTAGLSSGTAWTNASDRRLKDIHGDYPHGLNEILQLHTVVYNYKKDNALGLASDFTKSGFIAQEVQKVIPEAVTERKDGYLELNVDPIHWAVVNAVKELYHRWFSDSQELRREIASVKADNVNKDKEIEDLKKRLHKIEELLEKNNH